MNGARQNSGLVRPGSVALVLYFALGPPSAFLERLSAQERKPSGAVESSGRMADGKLWTTQNLNVPAAQSYCYEDSEENCRKYGRLYTWESARRACQSLGEGWRLPANEEWRQLGKHYGGIREESADQGNAAYRALMTGGGSGFNAVYGGGRTVDGQYARADAHGFYWTSTESDAAHAWFYNLGKGGRSLNRHSDGEKLRALAVRCVRD